MRHSKPHHHTIDYVEISARDLVSATEFYANAFGWSFNNYGDAYAGIKEADGEAGGISSMRDATENPPLVILYSENLEATLESVIAAGGRVTEGPYPFPGGRRFHFEDPSGNHLAVWSKK